MAEKLIKRVFVLPGKDRLVPIEGNPRRYVPTTGMSVPNNRYYKKQISRGDLLVGKDSKSLAKLTN